MESPSLSDEDPDLFQRLYKYGGFWIAGDMAMTYGSIRMKVPSQFSFFRMAGRLAFYSRL
ncbi:hypothetical protein MAR_003534 [Mya arenaria]|uniref:Uncharacterized protein n=1 Tax=Mya arenaria TaxID=6604 RepID=A0ABY7GFJ4_MYAAR|nr:hypothetical protein MAR_003534 [Mya arenaria]